MSYKYPCTSPAQIGPMLTNMARKHQKQINKKRRNAAVCNWIKNNFLFVIMPVLVLIIALLSPV